jgi:hypothetical protein
MHVKRNLILDCTSEINLFWRPFNLQFTRHWLNTYTPVKNMFLNGTWEDNIDSFLFMCTL